MSGLSNWTKRLTPGLSELEGARVRLEPLDWTVHGGGLFAAVGGPANVSLWDWMPVGPFPDPDSMRVMLEQARDREGWRTLVVRRRTDAEVLGMATYMRVREAHGGAEIGCVAFGPRLKRTPEATETFALMAGHLFDGLGYRRYEWKCDFGNLASKRAAERFGFVFEGVFRNDMVIRGRSRDTAWYSIIDTEWPILKAALDRWLAPGNFATDGGQLRTLESFRQPR